jgi:aspartyl-tRNA(Asn)/glutamyl-tRNA(Gln) amidotransferase subunit C
MGKTRGRGDAGTRGREDMQPFTTPSPNHPPTPSPSHSPTPNQLPHSPTPPMIDLEQVRKVAHLARLELTPEEEGQFTTQLNSILEYVEQLSELDTTDVPPTTRAIETSNITRPDQLEVFGDREALLNTAPEREDDYFKVPKILE